MFVIKKKNIMEFEKIQKGRGFVYTCNGEIYIKYCKKNGVLYVKCTVSECRGSAKINEGETTLNIIEEHVGHTARMEEVINLKLKSNCRKRTSEDFITPLKTIFEDEARLSGLSSIPFVAIESRMYRKRRLQQSQQCLSPLTIYPA